MTWRATRSDSVDASSSSMSPISPAPPWTSRWRPSRSGLPLPRRFGSPRSRDGGLRRAWSARLRLPDAHRLPGVPVAPPRSFRPILSTRGVGFLHVRAVAWCPSGRAHPPPPAHVRRGPVARGLWHARWPHRVGRQTDTLVMQSPLAPTRRRSSRDSISLSDRRPCVYCSSVLGLLAPPSTPPSWTIAGLDRQDIGATARVFVAQVPFTSNSSRPRTWRNPLPRST